MLVYLKKFNDLPAELRRKISGRETMAAIEKLEKKYELHLASLIMKVMVKEIALADLASFLREENLSETAASRLAEELKEKIFSPLADYLRLSAMPASPKLQPGELARNSVPQPIAAPAGQPGPLKFKAGPSDQPSVKGAGFFFSPEDEREIRELSKKIDVAGKTELTAAEIEANLEAIISRVQINFGSADLADRFKVILKIYLRGIRNSLETKLTLIKPFLSGGLSFDEESARKVMIIADKIIHSAKSRPIGRGAKFKAEEPVKSPRKTRLSELDKRLDSQPLGDRDVPYNFLKPVKEKINSSASGSGFLDTSHELAPLTPAGPAAKPKPAAAKLIGQKPFSAGAENSSAPKLEPDRSVRRALPASPKLQPGGLKPGRGGLAGQASQMPLIKLRSQAENLSSSQKVRVEDVKYVPRVISPLDELKYLDLINFRRLSQDTLKAIDKIKSKISLLEEESYGKKLEGIRFWRSSPLNRMYLEIGNLSISENKPIDVIIKERKNQANDYLTAAEFKAIMDLNKSLRF